MKKLLMILLVSLLPLLARAATNTVGGVNNFTNLVGDALIIKSNATLQLGGVSRSTWPSGGSGGRTGPCLIVRGNQTLGFGFDIDGSYSNLVNGDTWYVGPGAYSVTNLVFKFAAIHDLHWIWDCARVKDVWTTNNLTPGEGGIGQVIELTGVTNVTINLGLDGASLLWGYALSNYDSTVNFQVATISDDSTNVTVVGGNLLLTRQAQPDGGTRDKVLVMGAQNFYPVLDGTWIGIMPEFAGGGTNAYAGAWLATHSGSTNITARNLIFYGARNAFDTAITSGVSFVNCYALDLGQWPDGYWAVNSNSLGTFGNNVNAGYFPAEAQYLLALNPLPPTGGVYLVAPPLVLPSPGVTNGAVVTFSGITDTGALTFPSRVITDKFFAVNASTALVYVSTVSGISTGLVSLQRGQIQSLYVTNATATNAANAFTLVTTTNAILATFANTPNPTNYTVRGYGLIVLNNIGYGAGPSERIFVNDLTWPLATLNNIVNGGTSGTTGNVAQVGNTATITFPSPSGFTSAVNTNEPAGNVYSNGTQLIVGNQSSAGSGITTAVTNNHEVAFTESTSYVDFPLSTQVVTSTGKLYAQFTSCAGSSTGGQGEYHLICDTVTGRWVGVAATVTPTTPVFASCVFTNLNASPHNVKIQWRAPGGAGLGVDNCISAEPDVYDSLMVYPVN